MVVVLLPISSLLGSRVSYSKENFSDFDLEKYTLGLKLKDKITFYWIQSLVLHIRFVAGVTYSYFVAKLYPLAQPDRNSIPSAGEEESKCKLLK